jgi:hypothetical protein
VSWKLLAILAPVLAATALAMPAVVQASPHYYINGSSLPEGERVPVLQWGQLTFEAEASTSVLTCETVAGGFVENPTGGGPGNGQTTRFATWCVDKECPPGEVEIEGHNYEKQFEVIAPPQDLPWHNELIGPVGHTKLNSTGVIYTLGCYAHGLTKAENETGKATGPGENEQFPLAQPVRCETVGTTHVQDPENINGSNQGNLQSRLVFNQPAGSGLSCAGGAVTARTTGTLKTMGYEASGLLTVRSP